MVQLVREATGLTRDNGGASQGAAARFVCSGDVPCFPRPGVVLAYGIFSAVKRENPLFLVPVHIGVELAEFLCRTLRFGGLGLTTEVEVPTLTLIASSNVAPLQN